MRKTPKFVIARIHGKCIGGGVGPAAAADYAIAAEGADIKLSELAVGIGPCCWPRQKENRQPQLSQLSIDASMWRPADWARRKGLYAELHSDTEGMDDSIARLSTSLSNTLTPMQCGIEKVLWHGTEHWDELLERTCSYQRQTCAEQLYKGIYRQV